MELISQLYLLFLWVGSTSAQQIGPHDVVTVSEGADALLSCALDSGQSIDKFDWRKDNGEDEEKKEVFLYDRGSHYGNGLRGQNEQFKNRIVFFQHELKEGNASIKIKNTRLEDNGTYTCVLFVPLRREFNIRLNVGAARVPYIKTIHDKITWRLLECKAEGVPKPEVEWRSSAGKVSHVKEINPHSHNENVLLVNVTKTDNYTCVATQREIFHQITNTLEVSIPENNPDPNALTGWIVAGVLGALLSLLSISIIIRCLYKSQRRERSDHTSSLPLASQSS